MRVRDPRHTVTPHQAPYLVRISTYTLHINSLTTLLHVQALLDQCVVTLESRILRIVACQARVYLRHLMAPQRAIRCAFSSTIIIYPPCRAIILACEPAFAILVSTCVKIRFYLVFHACIRRRLIKHPSDPQTKLLGLTTCFIHIHTTSCHFVALAHTICALFYLHPSTPLDGDSPNFSALTSDLLLYTYAHQVDVKSQKLSPYVCKMGRGA